MDTKNELVGIKVEPDSEKAATKQLFTRLIKKIYIKGISLT